MQETINWKQKLSSRKFWVSVAMFISGLCIAFIDAGYQWEWLTITKIIAGTALSTFGGYGFIKAEGRTDAAREESNQTINESSTTATTSTAVSANTTSATTADKILAGTKVVEREEEVKIGGTA